MYFTYLSYLLALCLTRIQALQIQRFLFVLLNLKCPEWRLAQNQRGTQQICVEWAIY